MLPDIHQYPHSSGHQLPHCSISQIITHTLRSSQRMSNKAIVLPSKGTDLELQTRAIPIPGLRQIAIKSYAVAINSIDNLMQSFGFRVPSCPCVIGSDISGVICTLLIFIQNNNFQPPITFRCKEATDSNHTGLCYRIIRYSRKTRRPSRRLRVHSNQLKVHSSNTPPTPPSSPLPKKHSTKVLPCPWPWQ